MSTITLIAIIVPLIWVGWLILTEWVPMFPLNDLEASTVRERATTGAMNYTVGLVIAGGVLIGEPWSLVVAVVISVLALAGHLGTGGCRTSGSARRHNAIPTSVSSHERGRSCPLRDTMWSLMCNTWLLA